jgi:hypothetical protein
MQDLIFGFLGVCVLWFLFDVARTFLQGYKEGKQAVAHQMILKLAEITHRVEYEQREDVTYWFDQDTGEFLAQGKDFEEIVTVIKQRYPKHMFFLPEQKAIHAPAWAPVEFSWETSRVIFDGDETRLDK